MSTCLVTLDPRTLSVVLSDFEPRERSTLISLLAHMWCNEGHVEASAKVLARRAGLRPSSFHKSLAILLDGGALALRDGRIHLGAKLEWMMRRVSLTPEQRAKVHKEEKRCTYCGTEDGPFDIDHIHPVSRGGTNHRRNLALACSPCNSVKRAWLLSELGGSDV